VAQNSTVSATIASDISIVSQLAGGMVDGSDRVNASAGGLSELSENLKRMAEQFKV
jgi:methyl-accepting chemotaxis protein